MKLSHVERVMLANQYKILSLLDERNADGHDLVREALENGYESYYSDAMSREVYEDELSPGESHLVIAAMDLYWAMQRSYAETSPQCVGRMGRPTLTGKRPALADSPDAPHWRPVSPCGRFPMRAEPRPRSYR